MANAYLDQVYTDLNRAIFRRKLYDGTKKAFFEVAKNDLGQLLGPTGREFDNMQQVDDYIKQIKNK